MREIQAKAITAKVKELFLQANIHLPADTAERIRHSACEETEPAAQIAMKTACENLEAAEKLSGHKNFFVDTSSSMAFIGVEKAKSLIEIFTPEQVLFATDYPMYAQKTEINNILSMGFNDEDLEKIFSKNAKKVFSL